MIGAQNRKWKVVKVANGLPVRRHLERNRGRMEREHHSRSFARHRGLSPGAHPRNTDPEDREQDEAGL
ncbi:MAG: hypothetical protein EBX52_08660 [Proteobacteria bacterium]|nr:hypothetical protein [Pseudomonadota bacterium]